MRDFAPATSLVDLRFQGHPEYIACYVLHTSRGIALIDPGPSSTLSALEESLRLAGFSFEAVTDVLLTHIHLDHAGATGSIVRDHPDVRVHVHARGARHMVDPTRLLASASRLYGDRMDTLWGEFIAVPTDRVNVLEGGETLALGGRELEVAYTPGHASHHVSYFDPDGGLAFVGDTLGIRIDNRPYVMPVTPPPDIDPARWTESHRKIRAWAPDTLCPTHFGPARPAEAHIDEHEQRLAGWAAGVEEAVATGADAQERARQFALQVQRDIEGVLGKEQAAGYAAGGGLTDSWHGLARYFTKRATKEQQ
ncbi:MAG: MBL fold metallo-hydrolase [Acidobacteria bacterium]|nr:MBL fold metallo-hydrolase [Acidobacteriota bacterium]